MLATISRLGVPLPAFDPPDGSQVDLRHERKLLLRQALLLTEPANVPAQYQLPIPHCRKGRTGRMSDIGFGSSAYDPPGYDRGRRR
jgi:hypothetical protein